MSGRFFARASRASGVASLLALAVMGVDGCQGDGFDCGRPVGDSDVVRRCDRSLEICVCATNSCAKRVSTPPESDGGVDAGTGSGGCESGYAYVETPFAKREIAGKCVPPSDLELAPTIANDAPSGTLCPGAVLPPDAGSGGTGGTSGGAAGGGGTPDDGIAGEPSGGTSGSGSGGTSASGAGGMSGGEGGQ